MISFPHVAALQLPSFSTYPRFYTRIRCIFPCPRRGSNYPPRALAVMMITATRAGIKPPCRAGPCNGTGKRGGRNGSRQPESNGRGSAGGRYHRTPVSDCGRDGTQAFLSPHQKKKRNSAGRNSLKRRVWGGRGRRNLECRRPEAMELCSRATME